MKTLKEAAQSALDVQNACNLSGVLHSFVKAISLVREEAANKGKGTDWINNHPICKLYSDKVAHLTGMQGDIGCVELGKAHGDCQDIADGRLFASSGDKQQ